MQLCSSHQVSRLGAPRRRVRPEPDTRRRSPRASAAVRSGAAPFRGHRELKNAEDTLDRAELSAARAEADYVPWDEVKADLGLV